MKRSNEGEGEAADPFVVEGQISLISRTAEAVGGSADFRAIAGGSSASTKSGSVMHGRLCKGVEDSRCSLLACMTPPLPRAVMGVVDKDASEWPLGSFGGGLPGCTSMNAGADTSPTDGAARSTAEEVVESIVATAVAAASWSGVSCTLV